MKELIRVSYAIFSLVILTLTLFAATPGTAQAATIKLPQGKAVPYVGGGGCNYSDDLAIQACINYNGRVNSDGYVDNHPPCNYHVKFYLHRYTTYEYIFESAPVTTNCATHFYGPSQNRVSGAIWWTEMFLYDSNWNLKEDQTSPALTT